MKEKMVKHIKRRGELQTEKNMKRIKGNDKT